MDRAEIEDQLCESITKHCPQLGSDKSVVRSMADHLLVSYDHAANSLGIKSDTTELAKLEKHLKIAKNAFEQLPRNIKERLNYEMPLLDDEEPPTLEEQIAEKIANLKRLGPTYEVKLIIPPYGSEITTSPHNTIIPPKSPRADLGLIHRRFDQLVSLLEGAISLLRQEDNLQSPTRKTDYVAAAVAHACRKIWAGSHGGRAPRQIQDARFEQPIRKFIEDIFKILEIKRSAHGAMERAKRIVDDYIKQLEDKGETILDHPDDHWVFQPRVQR